jgi:predicted phage terminase large subunit-like protein
MTRIDEPEEDWGISEKLLRWIFGFCHDKGARYHGLMRHRERRGEGDSDLLAWGQKYLPDHFRQPPSNMHRWMAKQFDAARAQRGTKINVLGPRGGAKSTIGTLALPLRAALERRENYIWIVSDTKHQACAHLENIKAELLDNPRLAADFPDAVGRGLVWRGNSIVLRNGVTIEAFGTGQRIRGRRHRQHRPTLIVCDDLQNDGHIRSPLQREHSRDWFHGALLKAGTARTTIINLATALHRDALAMQLHRTPGWTSRIFKAIVRWPTNMSLWQQWETIYTRGDCPEACGESSHLPSPACGRGAGGEGRVSSPRPSDGRGVGGEGGSGPSRPSENTPAPLLVPAPSTHPSSLAHHFPNYLAAARQFYDEHRQAMDSGAIVLWPAVEDLYTLMCMRAEGGRTAFEREKQNSPINPDLCEWPESYFDETIWFDQWPAKFAVKTMALDPSKGSDSRRGDYSALVVLGVDRQGILYVEADLARRPTPEIVADGVECFRRHQPDVFAVEANQFQDLLAGEFEQSFRRQGMLAARPIPIENHTAKPVRIRRLGPYLSTHRIRFKSNSPGTKLLVEQLQEFPIADHDDGPDALEMALRLAVEVLNGRAINDGLGSRLPVG